MKEFAKLEQKLEGVFTKQAPFQIPGDGRKMIVAWSPWINLILGVFVLFSVKWLWNLGHQTDSAIDAINQITRTYGVTAETPSLGLFYWLSLISLAVEGVLMLLAVPGLKARSKSRGWNLVFIGLLLNALYGLFYLFAGQNGSLGQLVSAILGTVVGLYVLFQVREFYTRR